MTEQTNAPRVVASHTRNAITEHTLANPVSRISPGVELTISFDLGDHDTALATLGRAVADVTQQINQTAEATR